MAVSFDASSAKISVAHSKVKPALFIGGGVAVCNLTNGFNDVNNLGDAWSATGEVGASGPAAEIKLHTVNFLQFQKMRAFSATFLTGEFVAPERVLVTPAFTPNPALDAQDFCTPFANGDPVIVNAGKAFNVMGDHPASKMPVSVMHRNDGRDAMITSITDSREFWTAFVVRPPGGRLQYLAHFHWELSYSFSLEWELGISGMRVRRLMNSSTFNFENPVLGPPKAADIAAMLANPQPPQANDVVRTATQAAMLGGPPNRMDLAF